MNCTDDQYKEMFKAGFEEYEKGLKCIPSYWQASSFKDASSVYIAGYKTALEFRQHNKEIK